jgi:hypothetical protein
MNFKYTWKKLSENGLLKDIKDDYDGNVFWEYDTEEAAIEAVKEQLNFYQYVVPRELVLIKVLNISWEGVK